MVPREILNYTTSRGSAQLLNDFGMSIQMLECRCERVDVTRLHYNSFHAIAHHIACFARGDLWQRSCRGFICDVGAGFPLRRKKMYRALVKIILTVQRNYHYPHVTEPALLNR